MSTQVILVVNRKGGVGKSTVCLHCAGMLAMAGYSVLIIDQDPQNSSAEFWVHRKRQGHGKTFDIVSDYTPLSKATLAQYSEGYDFVIIDSPPGTEDSASGTLAVRKTTIYAMEVADLIVVPFPPGWLELKSGIKFIKYVSMSCKKRGKQNALIVMNRANRIRSDWKKVKQHLQDNSPIPVAEQIIPESVDFTKPLYIGRTAADFESKARVILDELVFNEFSKYIRVSRSGPARDKA